MKSKWIILTNPYIKLNVLANQCHQVLRMRIETRCVGEDAESDKDTFEEYFEYAYFRILR